MRKILLAWTAGLGTAISLLFSSCTYDPYYSSAGGYSGYGDGYGYGGSNFSTSLFVTTGDPRWGYDPHTYCYYDYSSRRYYDPYLYGYYPVGYRPNAVYGVPHPHGWRKGYGHCPPPRTIRNVTVVNYRDRESAYRNSNHSWARQVKKRTPDEYYRHAGGESRHYKDKQPDYRTDSRTRHGSDRDAYRSNNYTQWNNNRSREHAQDSRYKHRDYRPQEHSQMEQAARKDSHKTTRESRPEHARSQSMPHPKENRRHDGDQSREQAPPSDLREKKEKESKSERKGLRSLGDA